MNDLIGSLHDKNTKSQCDLILQDLKAGKKITQLEAYHKYGSTRLGARIYDLKKQGHQINKRMVKNQNNGKHYAQYSLEVN